MSDQREGGIGWTDQTWNPVRGAADEHLDDAGYRALNKMLVMDPRSWPLPNVWLGVSVEDQRRADERIPLLLETPAAVRFVSAEPLLGPVDLATVVGPGPGPCFGCPRCDATHVAVDEDGCCVTCGTDTRALPGLDWVIGGCESGPGARPTYPDWYRFLRDQCQAASVPFFLKQATAARSGIFAGPGSTTKAGGVIAAPYLDGRQWLEFPR